MCIQCDYVLDDSVYGGVDDRVYGGVDDSVYGGNIQWDTMGYTMWYNEKYNEKYNGIQWGYDGYIQCDTMVKYNGDDGV